MDEDRRGERLRQQYPEWDVSCERVSESRVSWSARPVGTGGEPSFSTFSWEELELYLATHDPEEVAQ